MSRFSPPPHQNTVFPLGSSPLPPWRVLAPFIRNLRACAVLRPGSGKARRHMAACGWPGGILRPRGIGARHGMGIDGIVVGLNAIGLLCIGARNDYVCRPAL